MGPTRPKGAENQVFLTLATESGLEVLGRRTGIGDETMLLI
jgi:hypothetical protein